MTTLITEVAATARRVLARRARYRRIVADLNALSIDAALDLDIHHGDIRAIARRAARD